MCEQSIRDRTGRIWTGRLTDHLGSGLAEVDVEGKRYVGVKVTLRRPLLNGTDLAAFSTSDLAVSHAG